MTKSWPMPSSFGTTPFFWQVRSGLRDGHMAADRTLHSQGPAGFDCARPPRTAQGRVVLVGSGKKQASRTGMWWMLDLQTPSISSSICPTCHVSQPQLSGTASWLNVDLAWLSWQIQIRLDLENYLTFMMSKLQGPLAVLYGNIRHAGSLGKSHDVERQKAMIRSCFFCSLSEFKSCIQHNLFYL